MKRKVIILNVLLMTAITAFTQKDIVDKTWTNGDIQYSSMQEGRVIGFSGFDGHEGGFGFILVEPLEGKIVISESYEGLGYSKYVGGTAEYKRIEGQELLIIRDKAGKHIDVLVTGTRQDIITSAFLRFISGSYRDTNGKGYEFSANETKVSGFGDSEQNYTFEEVYYLPDFIISIGNKSYMIAKDRQENGSRLRFEQYAKNSEDDWAPIVTAGGGAVEPLLLMETAWEGDTSGEKIPGRYPYTSQMVMTWRDLVVFSLDELDIMRNEIFARHGHTFRTARYRDHFNAQQWYKATTNDATNQLTEIEQLNIAQIVMVQNFIRSAN